MQVLKDQTVEENEKHEEVWGGYNDFPPNWHEITEEQFVKSRFFIFGIDGTETRQMMIHPDGTRQREYVSARLFFMHDNTGVAIAGDYWSGKLKFYAFGCKHEWGDATEELAARNRRLESTERALFCTKCKHFQIIDSSD